MAANRLAAPSAQNIVPKLLTLFGRPTVVALVDGDNELAGFLQEVQ